MKKLMYISCLLLIISCNQTTPAVQEKNLLLGDSAVAAVQTAIAEKGNLDNVITLNGTVTVNESNTVGVYSLVSGKINRVFVEQGDFVNKSKTLATISSAETSEAASLLTHKENQVAISQKNLDLKKELFEQNLATAQEIAEAEFELNLAKSELTHAKSVANLKGGQNGIHALKAPISGYVIQKNIQSGSELREDRDDALFTISDLNEVWVIANVFEQDIANIRTGAPVVITTLTSHREWKGKIDKIYKVLDEENRTMKVRVSLKNAGNELMPGMFAKVTVTAKPYDEAIVIPSQAVLLSNSKHHVVLKTADGKLEPRQIEIIRRVNGNSLIRGLQAGDEVVLTTPLLYYEELTKK